MGGADNGRCWSHEVQMMGGADDGRCRWEVQIMGGADHRKCRWQEVQMTGGAYDGRCRWEVQIMGGADHMRCRWWEVQMMGGASVKTPGRRGDDDEDNDLGWHEEGHSAPCLMAHTGLKVHDSTSPIERADQSEASSPPCWRVQLLSCGQLVKKVACVGWGWVEGRINRGKHKDLSSR